MHENGIRPEVPFRVNLGPVPPPAPGNLDGSIRMASAPAESSRIT